MSASAVASDAFDEAFADAVRLRQLLHARPELGHAEHQTVALLERELIAPAVTRVAGTGLIARLGPRTGPQVLLRAELDGLPVTEDTAVAWRATGGTMHACGHDVHMAALVGACRLLAQRPLRTGVVAVFQPCEEAYPSGAQKLVQTGAFDGLDIDGIVAFHLHPDVGWGSVAVTDGPVNAAADEVRITVEGNGGHAAYPYQACDPVAALCHVVVALQQVIARRTDPMHPTVLSLCTLQAGHASNTIPDLATATGTLRCLVEEDRETVRAMIRQAVAAAASVGGCDAEVTFTEGEPALFNDDLLARRVRARLDGTGLEPAAAMRSCGADDFGYFGSLGPTLMGFVGLDGHPGFERRPLHHPGFLPPHDAVGAMMRAFIAGYEAVAADSGDGSPGRARPTLQK